MDPSNANPIVTAPVTKKAYEMGFTAARLWREAKVEGLDYTYGYFMKVIHGREKCPAIETWIRKWGLGPELDLAQKQYREALEQKKDGTDG